MKKSLASALIVSVLALAAMFAVNPVSAEIESTSWLGSFYRWGTDPYYGASVYGYEEGSTATLLVEVKNHLATQMNVSEIIIGFDWNKNYTTTFTSPIALKTGDTNFFTASFAVPNTTVASNLYLHGYIVYVKHVNSTGGLVGTMTKNYMGTSDRLFAVYSKDQADARETSKIISGISSPPGGFNSTAAKLSWVKAENETEIADLQYRQGNFADAKTHYSRALNYLNEAFVVENAIAGGFEDAQLALIQAQAKSFDAQANYLNGLSNMWVLIGVAAVLFAIGYIIRGLGALRKPVVATS